MTLIEILAEKAAWEGGGRQIESHRGQTCLRNRFHSLQTHTHHHHNSTASSFILQQLCYAVVLLTLISNALCCLCLCLARTPVDMRSGDQKHPEAD